MSHLGVQTDPLRLSLPEVGVSLGAINLQRFGVIGTAGGVESVQLRFARLKRRLPSKEAFSGVFFCSLSQQP